MNRRESGSTANGALWVIALSLAVIAACLIVLVTRNETSPALHAPEQAASTMTARPETDRKPGISPIRHTLRQSQPDRAGSEPAAVKTTEAQAAIEPTVPAAAEGPKPIVASGLAPLTSLEATNGLGVIAGRVTLLGSPPPEIPIPFDAVCGKLRPNPVTTRRFVVSADGGLADVFVFIKSGLEGRKFATPREPVILDQKGCLFEPYVLGLMVNQPLRIKNSDKCLHSVNAQPIVSGNQSFDLTERPGAELIEKFLSPELGLRLSCDSHPWMFAYACVVDNPFHAITDANGNYSITNVPPGNYVLEAYHVKTRRSNDGETQKVQVTADSVAVADFTIRVSSSRGRLANKN